VLQAFPRASPDPGRLGRWLHGLAWSLERRIVCSDAGAVVGFVGALRFERVRWLTGFDWVVAGIPLRSLLSGFLERVRHFAVPE
jgi:hypothetical protein